MSIKNIVMGIAIIILTIFVSVYGINTFYERPEYEDFCPDVNTQEIIETAERCEEVGGKWTVYERVKSEGPEMPKSTGFCDRDYVCRQEYDTAREKYSKNVFLIALPLGILIIAGGAFLFSLEAVGAGLMGGGVGTLIFGIGGYWEYADNLMKFITSLLGLGAVIYLTYWFNNKTTKKKK